MGLVKSFVGKVHKEIQIPITDKENADYCKNVIRDGCVEYLQQMIRLIKEPFISNSVILHNNQGGSSDVKRKILI